MARTHPKFTRLYIDGYDLSTYTAQIGESGAEFDAAECIALSDECKNYLLGQPQISFGPVNGFLAPAVATGLHELMSPITTGAHNVMMAIGVGAIPAAGNPVFAWPMSQASYKGAPGDGVVAANIEFGGADYSLLPAGYNNPWGVLLHANSAETAVNTAIGIDDNGAASALGGVFSYQILSSNGTVTVKAQDAAVNNDGGFADLSGATSGSVNASVTPKSGCVAIGVAATVRRYLRWQIVFGTATTVTFLCSFSRKI